MPWVKSQTLNIGGTSTVIGPLMAGLCPEVLIHARNFSGSSLSALYASIDGTNFTTALSWGGATVFSGETLDRLPAYPYYRVANIQGETYIVDFYEWVDKE